MRIAIVNDLPLAVEALRRVLAASKRHSVAWVAVNGEDAVRKAREDRPDLILMDIMMPVMGGVEATRQIMRESPCAILLVTATVDGHVTQVFEGLGAGALDAVNTPALFDAGRNMESQALLYKIESVERQLQLGQQTGKGKPVHPHATGETAKPVLVAIGASAGGPAALAVILAALPKDFPAAVVIVQHVDEQFTASMASWLSSHSQMPVRLAEEQQAPAPGVALIAGRSSHLLLTKQQLLAYSEQPTNAIYRPSIDVFFNSACEHWTGDIIGVLLTGMGADGATGLKRLRSLGVHTIAQDRKTSAVYGMPKAAAALDAALEILPLEAIAPALEKQVRRLIDKQNANRNVR